MITFTICLFVFSVFYLAVVIRITRVTMKREFDREYQWLAKNIEWMTEMQADVAIINFSNRWEGHINDFTLSCHVSRLVKLRFRKCIR
jgi:hypothetical protein